MMTLKRFVSLTLVAALVTPQVYADGFEKYKAEMSKIDLFIQDFNKSAFLPLLVDEELMKIMATKNLDLPTVAMLAMVNRYNTVTDGPAVAATNTAWNKPPKTATQVSGACPTVVIQAKPDDKEENPRLRWSEEQAKWQECASEVAKSIFAQSISDINRLLLSLLHRFTFEEGSRQAISFIYDGLASHRFNPQEQYRLRKEANELKRFSDGSVWTLLVVSAALMVRGLWKLMPKVWEREGAQVGKTAGKTAAEQAGKAGAAHAAEPTVNDMLDLIERQGITSSGPVSTSVSLAKRARTAGIKVVSNLSKFRSIAKVNSMLSWDNIKRASIIMGKNLVKVGGVSIGGGIVYAGFPGFISLINKESMDNTVADFTDLRENYYDGLTVLNLTCKSHELVQQSDNETEVLYDLRKQIVELNKIYTEFELLKRLNPSLVSIVKLPQEVQVEKGTGKVTFSRPVLGQQVKEEFECAKLKDSQGGDVSVSVLELLSDIDSAVHNISYILKHQDRRMVVPGAPQ